MGRVAGPLTAPSSSSGWGKRLPIAPIEIAQLQVNENGKLIREMAGQARLMPEYFNYYAGLAQMPTGRTNPLHLKDVFDYTVREPLLASSRRSRRGAPHCCCWCGSWDDSLWPQGNTVIAKPSEVTPVSTLRIAGLPRKPVCRLGYST